MSARRYRVIGTKTTRHHEGETIVEPVSKVLMALSPAEARQHFERLLEFDVPFVQTCHGQARCVELLAASEDKIAVG